MKILFAVSNENISNAIVKNYQKKFNEPVTFKNVFYFNAITKELQKDKTYNAIVISEDLEPFANSNYEVIDKFILGRLENISSTIDDMEDARIPIVLICTDRRTKSGSMISSYFDLKIYNALVGTDRKIDEVCRLIASPRNKEEARKYYNLASDEQENSSDDVSELEVQNILIHYRRLGDNEEKYVESFNNIASQYNDNQLRIIIRYLPIKVKAVLEAECHKYQELVMSSTQIESDRELKAKEKEKDRRLREKFEKEQKLKDKINKEQKHNKKDNNVIEQKINEQSSTNIDILDNKRKQPRMNSQVIIPGNINTKNERKLFSEDEIKEREDRNIIANNNVNRVQEKQYEELDEDLFEDLDTNNIIENIPEVKENFVEPVERIEETEIVEPVSIEEEQPKKRGRGRPRKNPIPTEPKPKGKRGRPRKNPIPDEGNIKNEIDESVNRINSVEQSNSLPGFEEDEDDMFEPVNQQNTVQQSNSLPGFEEDEDDMFEPVNQQNTVQQSNSLPGFEEDEDDMFEPVNQQSTVQQSNSLPGFEEDEDDMFESVNQQSTVQQSNSLPGFEEDEDDFEINSSMSEPNSFDDSDGFSEFNTDYDNSDYSASASSYNNSKKKDEIRKIEENKVYSTGSLSSVLTQDKKIAAFIGTSKNGVSFLVNNLAWLFSSIGINTAILDMTKNKNSYYIYTDNNEELRKIAYSSIEKLENGVAEGIHVDRNLTVYTAVPNEQPEIRNPETVLTTLARNHSLILIDCDYDTDYGYFANIQELYLVQSMDVLTIQPLTTFLRELKTRGILDPQKLRAVINKEVKVSGVNSKTIIGGMSSYNDPGMSFMAELFNKDKIKACTIPFDQAVYTKYLETMITCKISMNGYSNNFKNSLKILGNMVYPLVSKQTYGKQANDYGRNNFSDEMNNTLNQMKSKY